MRIILQKNGGLINDENVKKIISIFLAAFMLISMLAVSGMSATAATGTLASVYKTNPDGQCGKQASITIDGSASDWTEDMMIARSAAWDCPNHWKGAHENNLADCYALFGAWDSSNLYLGLQFVNTTDTWQNSGDASLMDGGKMGEIPIVLGLSVDPSSTGMTGKLSAGGGIWGVKSTFQTHVDHLFFMSAKVGTGEPAMFTADSTGGSDYTTHCKLFSAAGISYKKADTNICSEIWGLNYSDDPDDVFDDGADWVDYKTFKGSKGKHDIKYDTFYEMSIPFSVLGTTASYVTSNGIGAIFFGTRGESMMDCVPFDGSSMLDNALLEYRAGDNTSKEKEDDDIIAVPLARIGNAEEVDPTPVGDTLTVNAESNYFPSKSFTNSNGEQFVTVDYKLKSSAPLMNSQWSLTYDTSKLKFVSATMPNVENFQCEENTKGTVKGNFSTTNFANFSTEKDFVKATFKVLGSGTTTTNFNVDIIGVRYNNTNKYIVDNGSAQTVSGVTVTKSTSISGNNVMLGDVDGNGIISVADATLVQKHAAEMITLEGEALLAADTSKDGHVTVADATLIQKFAAEMIDEF